MDELQDPSASVNEIPLSISEIIPRLEANPYSASLIAEETLPAIIQSGTWEVDRFMDLVHECLEYYPDSSAYPARLIAEHTLPEIIKSGTWGVDRFMDLVHECLKYDPYSASLIAKETLPAIIQSGTWGVDDFERLVDKCSKYKSDLSRDIRDLLYRLGNLGINVLEIDYGFIDVLYNKT